MSIFLYSYLIVFATSVVAIPVEKFYPFGIENGDSKLAPVYVETQNAEIILKVPIKFYNENYTSIYVNADGLLSFLAPFPTFINVQFPLDYPIIAAFYAHADLSANGHVFYRETQNETLLSRATDEIRRAFSSRDFIASSLFVATWHKIGYFSRGNDKVNTFQVVIASNDRDSFVELFYADEGIQWLQGTGQPGTGLPDAKAQGGFVALSGRTYLLPGSGTDQIRNLMRLSNINEAGVWIFRMGYIPPEGNIEGPTSQSIFSEPTYSSQRESTCATGFSFCHSQAMCVDAANKYCCVCKKAFYGNGYNCLKEGVPLRATGKVNLDVDSIRVIQQDVQAFIVVADGRVYAAMSKIPPSLAAHLQLLYPVISVMNWLFAKTTTTGLNGFQITGGVLNHTAEIIYKDSSHRVSITQKYFGLDVFDHLKLEIDIRGSVPLYNPQDRIAVNDYQIRLNLVSSGLFRSSSSLTYNVTSSVNEETEKQISLEESISFKESCALEFNTSTGNVLPNQRGGGQYSYYRVKTSRNFFSYEAKENILRFAASSKVSLLTENEDPCVEGRVKCVVNSSCVVEDDSFVCLCNPGFRATYSNHNRNVDFGCLDVNECAEGTAACDSNAICVNEIGAYQCVCRPGYTGSGYQCAEVASPCGKDFSLCNPPNSYCSDPRDYRTCNCNPGYQKRYLDASQIGFTCVDIDECESAVCSADENCINLEGTYTCECKSTPGSGRSCKQLVSCAEVNNCSPNADCIFNKTSHSYACRCLSNYYGDGYFCKTYGGRQVVVKICTTNGCICPPNFIPLENLCLDQAYRSLISSVNPTVTCNMLTNMCHPHAQCIYNGSLSQYQCVCNAGYDGNGVECFESEMSCLKNDICDMHAFCQVNERTGKAGCVCNSHYHGDGLHCDYYGTCQVDNECGQNEQCVYNKDTFVYDCRCREGFVKSQQGTCRPIRVCQTCHGNALCVVDKITRDSQCECVPGYRGDGVYSCEKIAPPCNVEFNCLPYAKCEINLATNTYECRCKQGFVGNGTYCEDVRTCSDTPELCDRNARCVVKSYNSKPQCECDTGFIGNGATCAEIPKYEGGFLFVNYGMTTLRVPYEPSLSNSGYPIQLQANQIATGLTIDCILARVYWSDYYGRKIKSSTFKGKNITVLVENNVTAIEGLTADWINRVLYWVDSGEKVIESINLDGSQRKMIVSKNLTNPRGIVVHPYRRKLFWSDWDRAHPKIEWSNADGTDRSIFLSGPTIQLPNSVAIDWFTDELCWADAGTKRIMCANIETRQYRLITDSCVSPFGLTISTDRYYWTEWMLGKIGYYDKKTRKAANMTLPLISSGTLYGIINVPTDCP